MSEILDSGTRRQFSSGACRDISEDKGAMDLLPYETISNFAIYFEKYSSQLSNNFDVHRLFDTINQFVISNDVNDIYKLLTIFINYKYKGVLETAIIEYSIHLQMGAKKYKKFNWMIGIPTHCFLDSALRHAMKYLRGDTDEPHDRAFMWNLFGLLWTKRNHPELDDIFYGNTYNAEVINDYEAKWNPDKKEEKKEESGLSDFHYLTKDDLYKRFDCILRNYANTWGSDNERYIMFEPEIITLFNISKVNDLQFTSDRNRSLLSTKLLYKHPDTNIDYEITILFRHDDDFDKYIELLEILDCPIYISQAHYHKKVKNFDD